MSGPGFWRDYCSVTVPTLQRCWEHSVILIVGGGQYPYYIGVGNRLVKLYTSEYEFKLKLCLLLTARVRLLEINPHPCLILYPSGCWEIWELSGLGIGLVQSHLTLLVIPGPSTTPGACGSGQSGGWHQCHQQEARSSPRAPERPNFETAGAHGFSHAHRAPCCPHQAGG